MRRKPTFVLDLEIDPSTLPDPPKAFMQFLERIAADIGNHDRRVYLRYAIAKTAIAVPLDNDLVRKGEPFKVVTRDISARGIGILHTRAINVPHLGLRLPCEAACTIDVIMKLLRCRQLGLFYDIGGVLIHPSTP